MWVAELWSLPDMKSGRMERGRPSFFGQWTLSRQAATLLAVLFVIIVISSLVAVSPRLLVWWSGGVFGKDRTLLLSYVLVTGKQKSYFRYLPYEICKEE